MNDELLNFQSMDQASLSQDVHICGGCKLQFNSVKSFFLHKRDGCSAGKQQNEGISSTSGGQKCSNSNLAASHVDNVNASKSHFSTFSTSFSSTTQGVTSPATTTTTSTTISSNTNPNPVASTTKSTANKRFQCEVNSCQYKTCYLKDLLRHMRTHTGEKPFSCSICGKSFNRADKLKMHERWHTGAKPYKCKECDYATNDNSSLKKHLRVHSGERPFKCQICPYASRNSSQLVVHLRTHTGDSPFHCPVCNTKFKINSDLKRHLRMHTGEKPYICQLCDYRCAIKGNLKTHMKLNHNAENVQKCAHCEFTSSSRRAMREHEKTHDAKAVKCHQCPYTCTTRAALKNHQRIHSNERPFKCDYCPYASRQPGNVRTHIKKRHVDKLQRQKRCNKKSPSDDVGGSDVVKRTRSRPLCVKSFQCTFCDAAFVREDSLRSHLRQHHERITQLEGAATIAVLQLSTPVVSGNDESTVGENHPQESTTQMVDFALQTDPVVTSTGQNNVIEQALQQWGVIGSTASSETTPVIAYIQQNNNNQDGGVQSSSILATLLKTSESTQETIDRTSATINLNQSMSPLMYSLGILPVLSVSNQNGTSVVPDQNSSIQYIVHANPDGTTAPLLVNRFQSTEDESTSVSSQTTETTELQLLTTMQPSTSRIEESGLYSTANLGSFLTPVLVTTTQSSSHLQSSIKDNSSVTVLCANPVDERSVESTETL